MTDIDGLEFAHLNATQAREISATVEAVYCASYVEAIESGHEFDSPQAFMQRFDAYTSRPGSGFSYVLARLHGQPVGQAWGWPLPPNASWWKRLELDEDHGDRDAFTAEDGARTFGLSEIMVCAEHTGRGIARALHDELLRGRPERRGTLLVESDNTRAYERYRAWGWYRVGKLRPGWPDAPTFDVLMRDLG